MQILWAFVCVAIAVVGHASLCRIAAKANIITKLLTFFGVASFIGIVMLVRALVQGWSAESLAQLLLYAFACELYTFLFAMVATSVSALLLLKLRERSLTPTEINQLLGSDSIAVDMRLDKLLTTGFLEASELGYVVTDKGKTLLLFFRMLRRIFRQTAKER